MDKRSPRIPERRERIESRCMWGVFGILQSCQGLNSPKLISNGRHINRNLIDNNMRKLDQVTSFDEECRRIQQGVDVVKGTSDGSARSSTKDNLFVDKKSRRSSRKACQSSPSRLDDAANLTHSASTSSGTSLNKLTLAALLDAVSVQTLSDESSSSERFQNTHHRKYSQVDHIRIKQAQMSAKASVDKAFLDREIARKQGITLDSKCFSNSLATLSSNKDMSPEPKSLASRGIKNLHPSQTEIDAKSSDARLYGSPGSTLAAQDGKMPKHLSRKIDYRCFAAQPSDKLEIVKPDHKPAKLSEQVSCHCSSIQSPRSVNLTKSFSYRETKKKLQHVFGGASSFSTSDTLACSSKSSPKVGDDCIYCGRDVENCFDSSTKAIANGKKPERVSNRDSDISCISDTVRRKLDFSGNGFSDKLQPDVILEAKRHLSERLKHVNDSEIMRNEKSLKTLRGILASPEHDFSPTWGSHRVCSSPEMRFSSYSSPCRIDEISNGRDVACPSPLRSKTKVTTCDDHDMKKNEISSPESASSNGKSRVTEMDVDIGPGFHTTEVSSVIKVTGVTRATQALDSTELCMDDDSALHSSSDSLSGNEAFVSMADDFQSTHSSAYTMDSSKYQDEYQSPISVLEPFSIDEANSPQTALKQRRLKFEDHDPQMSRSSCILEQYPLSECVHMIMQASCLDWDRLSKITSVPELLLDASLFDEVEFLPTSCYFDSKLLFDHINEVLLEIQQSHSESCSWRASLKPRITSATLEQAVLDKITAEADFYLLPQTENRTLDQLVSKDVARGRQWQDIRLDTDEILVDISDELLEECTLEILLESLELKRYRSEYEFCSVLYMV